MRGPNKGSYFFISNFKIKKIRRNKIEILELKDVDLKYPDLLKQINNRPKKLYVLGNIDLLKRNCIAIVGCRMCSSYGKIIARKLAFNLAKKSIIIVSGLAKGIDTYAHLGALEANGKTIAVLANGLDTIYPEENINLARKIIEKDGALISEYPIGIKPSPDKFPKRNRIISGICKGTIVVEAKERSGSFITAMQTLEQNRNLYAVPGSIFSDNSKGTNKLIKLGAEPIINVDNINDINFI